MTTKKKPKKPPKQVVKFQPVRSEPGPLSGRIVLNRRLFMAWQEGVILELVKGKGICLDGSPLVKDFEAAEAAMDRGETIYLTDESGKEVTSMALETADLPEPGYVEKEL